MELSEEQKNSIRENYKSTPDLIELTRLAFNNAELDGRTKEGRAVRKFLTEEEFNYNTTQVVKKSAIELSEEQKSFIEEYTKDGMNSLQIARLIFPNQEVRNLSLEQRAVFDYMKTELNPYFYEEERASTRHEAPVTFDETLARLNKASQQNLVHAKMNPDEREGVKKLIKYLSSPRYMQTINNYKSQNDRDLFESEYIRTTWDKPDLTADEINLYINVCVDYINLKNISSHIEKLNTMFNEIEDQQEMTVRLAEILKSKTDEYDKCEKRMESLIKKLNGDRAARLKDRHKDNASILSLVRNFQLEEGRRKTIDLATREKEAVGEEIERLESMESWKARILGISKDNS